MLDHRRLAWIAIPLVLLAIRNVGQCHPLEPQATFTLKKGWVEIALHKDGRPMSNATIEVLDQHGGKYAVIEGLDEGRTTIPLPPGTSFVVEIKTGDRTADPIRVFKNGPSVEPARVLLSYGLRPCCRSIKPPNAVRSGAEEIETPPIIDEQTPWPIAVPVLAFVSIVAVVLFMLYRK